MNNNDAQPMMMDVDPQAPAAPQAEEEDEEQQQPKALRCDLARGMERCAPDAVVLRRGEDAPLFVVAFELDDPTSVPRLAVEAIWALNNVGCCIEKGEGGMYIHGLQGFSVDAHAGRKTILRGVERDGRQPPLSEVRVQVRVHEIVGGGAAEGGGSSESDEEDAASGGGGADGERRERYVLLVVRSPLAFSLRQAAYLTTQPVGRLMQVDQRGVDERRRVWARLATHVRAGVLPVIENAELLRRYESTMDWMRNSEAEGFTTLFSAQMALDWMRTHFRRRHGTRLPARMRGLHDPLSGEGSEPFVRPEFVDQCRAYDEDVTRETALSLEKKKKKRRRAGGDNDNNDNNNNDDERPHVATVRPVDGVVLDRRGARQGLPPCIIALEIVTPTSMEGQAPLVEFQRQVRTFPESVMLKLMQAQMRLPEALMAQITERMRGGHAMNAAEMRDVVMGEPGVFADGRARLSGGDAVWGRQMMAMSTVDAPQPKRLDMMRDFVRMGFALAYTRATGSDGYTNGRVAAYGRFMTSERGEPSRRECRRLHAAERLAFPDARPASATHRAWQVAMDLVLACDECMWHLRPDNLFLFMQLMVSDVMLCLDFYNLVVDGAFNGIGATVVVRDGGGNFRRRNKDRANGGAKLEVQVMDKGYSAGMDHTLNSYKGAMDIGAYERHFRPDGDVVSELKRVTELSLVQETCHIYEGLGSHLTLKHAVTETMGRKYSTELKAGGDLQSEKCMNAITWLIPRNTRDLSNSCFKSTREDERTKERIRVEYRQVMDGYWVICSNSVKEAARERFHTMLAVTRSVAASAGGIDVDTMLLGAEGGAGGAGEEGAADQDGRVDRMMSGANARLGDLGRGLFFASLGTAVFAGFMQWTGMLGQIRETRTVAALMQVFHAQLRLCQDLLNPDMASDGNRERFLEVSKARGVSASLLGIAVRETLDAGRRHEPQQFAVERTCLAFKAEGGAAAAAWIVADTLEHMLRLDFFVIMQALARKFRVPCVPLEDLLRWLDTGDEGDCPEAAAFIQLHSDPQAAGGGPEDGFMPEYGTDVTAGRGAAPARCCLYLTHSTLRMSRLETPFTPDVRTRFCEFIAKRLRDELAEPLLEYCRVKDSEEGDEIVRGMIEGSIDAPFTWPALLGPARQFWGLRPGAPQPQGHQRRVAPLRMILTETTVAQLAADARWLLLVSALSEGQLAQSARFSIVGQLVQRFYQHCVPYHMVAGDSLFIGLPSQVVGGGFVWPPLAAPARRRTLRRPQNTVGVDAPCPSGFVEDLGVAAPRYELAHMLNMPERALPTDCVHYEFPADVWTPALVDGAPGSVMWRQGRFWRATPPPPDAPPADDDDEGVEDITFFPSADDDEEEGFLGGRVRVPVRPLACFYRPGVLVRLAPLGFGVVGALNAAQGRYAIHADRDGPVLARMTPTEIEDALVPPTKDTVVRVRASALHGLAEFLQRREGGALVPPPPPPQDAAPAEAPQVEGRLEHVGVDDDALAAAKGCIALRLRRVTTRQGGTGALPGLWGASRGGVVRDECETRSAPLVMVPASAVVYAGPSAGAPSSSSAGGAVVFCGAALVPPAPRQQPQQ